MEADGYHIAMQPIQLTPGRYPLPKPYPESWSIERQSVELCREGIALLAAESQSVKGTTPPIHSVTPDPKTAVQDALAAKSTNPYTRARAKVLGAMSPLKRSQIEKMESEHKIDNPIYTQFIKAVMELGDKLSSSNN